MHRMLVPTRFCPRREIPTGDAAALVINENGGDCRFSGGELFAHREFPAKMAAQTAELSQAVITLHRRQRALIITVVVLACALLYVRWAS